VERRDLAGLERAAHSLKGSVANFGARRTSHIAFELEKTARNGNLEACIRLCTALDAEMAALKPELLKLGVGEA